MLLALIVQMTFTTEPEAHLERLWGLAPDQALQPGPGTQGGCLTRSAISLLEHSAADQTMRVPSDIRVPSVLFCMM